jgi:hypothetical protein
VNRSLALVLIVILGIPAVASAQRAFQVVRVSTDDPAGYLVWAEESAPALLGNNEGSIGACVPTFGAEDQVDAYWFNNHPNLGSLLSLDLNAPVAQRETAKIAESRSVVSRDVFVALKDSAVNEGGSHWTQYVLFVETKEPSRYVDIIGRMERALHDNGFNDVSWMVDRVQTGDYSGLLHVALSAPTGQRLGAALDAVNNASWSPFAQGAFDDFRTIVRSMFLDCSMYVSN